MSSSKESTQRKVAIDLAATDGPSMARLFRGRLLSAILTDYSSLGFDARLCRKGDEERGGEVIWSEIL